MVRGYTQWNSGSGLKGAMGPVAAASAAAVARVRPGTRLTVKLTVRPAGDTQFLRGHVPDGGPFGPVRGTGRGS